jgi:hypothetical protein
MPAGPLQFGALSWFLALTVMNLHTVQRLFFLIVSFPLWPLRKRRLGGYAAA